jgi:hypothetical protein
MDTRDDEVTFSREEQQLLLTATRPLPIDEAALQATIQLARMEQRRLGVRRRMVVASSGAAVLALLAASYWRWSGADSESGLTLAAAIEVTRDPGGYEPAMVQAAAGKVWRDASGVLVHLLAQGRLEDSMREAVVRAIDSPSRIPVAYSRGFEELRWKVTNGEPLSGAETLEITNALCAAVDAIRELRERDPRHEQLVAGLVSRLRKDALRKVPLPIPK